MSTRTVDVFGRCCLVIRHLFLNPKYPRKHFRCPAGGCRCFYHSYGFRFKVTCRRSTGGGFWGKAHIGCLSFFQGCVCFTPGNVVRQGQLRTVNDSHRRIQANLPRGEPTTFVPLIIDLFSLSLTFTSFSSTRALPK